MLLIQLLCELKEIGNKPIVATETDKIFIGTLKLISGIRTNINAMLFFCRNLDAIILYLNCVCIVVKKYCMSFWLDKCDLIQYIIKNVGHDVTDKGNCPSQIILNLINDWELPKNGQSLF